jgi:diguanylate cyclase (GGDEF)-like protein
LMIDVDHFKSFNDNFGHVAGDDALKLVAAEIAKSVRANDIAARFGGEEFCVLSFSTPEIALKIGERIRHAVEIFAWPQRAITVSIGICSMQGPAIDRSELFQHADEALYRAKEQGRNRVVVA